jgi:signal transduction histidine kinase
MKDFERDKVEKSDDNKDSREKHLITNRITTQNSYKENNYYILTFFSSMFIDTNLETKFSNEKKSKNIWITRLFKIITIIYVIINIIILPSNNSENEDNNTFSTAASYAIAALNVITIIVNFYVTKSSNFFIILCIEYVIFSSSHFVFLNQIRIINKITNTDISSLLIDNLNNTIPFIFTFTDILLKLIFIFSSMNNFIYLFWATIGNYLLILLYFITSDLIKYKYSPIALTFYFLGNIIVNFISRKFTNNEKILFREKILKIEALKKVEEEIKIFNHIKCGYFKIFNNQIREKNNFFEQEFEALKIFLKNKEKFSEKNLIEHMNLNKKESKLKREKTKSLNKDTSTKSLIESTQNSVINSQNFNFTYLTNDDCEEIIKNLILNIPDSEKFKIDLNLFLGNFLKPNKTKTSADEKKSVESVLKFKGPRPFASAANTLDLESSANNLLENNILIKEREKEIISLTQINPNNLTPNYNNKFSDLNNQEVNVCLTMENINNINNNKSQSTKLERKDSKITIHNFMRSPTFNKDTSPRRNPDHAKEKDLNNIVIRNLNTSILDHTHTGLINFPHSYSIFDYFTLNKSKFENFIKLGRSTITYGSDKILSLEVLTRVNEDNSIEFIFNDISKIDFASGFKQFLIKTGQYLHDFKNPLICIQNEISELKDEIEVLMAMVIKHNEFIDSYNKHMINISGATGSAGSPTAKKIDFSLQECLLVLDKFEYTRQMSEYCQSMIGSYEDFSKSIFTPQNLKISIQNFDLFNLINFIDSMMQFQLSRSNKNINFVLKLENFESNLGQDRNNNMISNNQESSISNNPLERKNSFLERKSTSEIFPNLQKLNRKNTLTNFNVHDNTSKLQITEKDLEIFEKPEIIGSDEAKLKRVLINILSNSQKFTISGSITLSVKKEVSNGIKYYKFSITDTGVGMSPGDLEKLFTPFFSNNNNEMNKNGVGLGLINVKEITEHLGQGLKVTSELGKGTTMSFVIEDRYIDPNANINIFNEKKTLNNINEVSESMDSDPGIDNDTTQEVGKEHFNLIFKKLPKMNSIEEEDSDRIFYQNKQEIQTLSTIQHSRKEYKDIRQEKFNNMEFISNSPASSYHFNLGSPYLRTGYTFVKLSPKVISRQSHKNILKFNRHPNLEGLTGAISPINITRSETIKNVNLSSSKQGMSSLFKSRKTWAINSLISSSTKFFDKVNTFMSNQNSNINCFSTFNKLTIHSDINFEVRRTYDRNEKETNFITCSNNLGTPTLMSSKKSSFQNFSQFKFKANNDEEQNLNSHSLSKFFENRKKLVQYAGSNHSIHGENQCGSIIDEEGKNLDRERERENNSTTAKTLNVLLIDDEQSIRAFSKNSFKKISESENIKFNIEEADDGISGLSKILLKFLRDQETYDLVIADDTMNFLDGSQLFKLLGLLIESEFFKRKLPENLINKFLICSSDSENVKNKMDLERENIENNNINMINFNIKSCYLMNSLEICDKPLNIKVLKQFC